MRRTVAAFILCVAIPALALAWLGLRRGDDFERREMDRLRAEAREPLLAAAREFAASAVKEPAKEDARPLIFVHADGRRAAPPPVGARDAEEARFYARSIRGGEREEFVVRDPLAAAEAYTFFLHELESPSLRASVILHAARCLRAAGETQLAESLYREVAERYRGVAGADGEPVDAIAGFALHGGGFESGADAALEALHALGHVPAEFVFGGKLFRFARSADPEILAGTWMDIEFPARKSGEPEIRFDPIACSVLLAAGEDPPARALESDEVAAEVVRTPAGTPIGVAIAASPRVSEIRSYAARRSLWMRGVVAVLAVVVVGGGVLVLRALRAEMRLLRLKSDFVANVSHEMKTPVSAVRLFAEMLAEDSIEPAKAREYARILRGESERLSSIVEKVIDFARLERGEMAMPIEAVDLAALLKQTAGAFALRAEREGVGFRAEIDGAGTIQSNGDAIARILQNLLDNAFKYRRREGPEVALRATSGGAGRIRIEVRDNGIGIPRAAMARLFEKFYRVRPEDPSIRGTGMGLALARGLARKLGGDIEVESADGEGSAFALVLPRGEEERPS